MCSLRKGPNGTGNRTGTEGSKGKIRIKQMKMKQQQSKERLQYRKVILKLKFDKEGRGRNKRKQMYRETLTEAQINSHYVEVFVENLVVG